MEKYTDWKNQLEFFFKNKKYPLCQDCSSIILVIKMDILKNTIEYKCENCFLHKEIKLLEYFNSRYYKKSKFEIKPTNIWEIHKKKVTYFCKTCIRPICDDCKEKERYPNHEFFDFNNNIINETKLKEIEIDIENENDCLIKTLNINDFIKFYNNSNIKKIKKYRDKTSSDILFNNKNFIRILYMHIYVKLLIPEYKKIIIKLYKEYPNDYFCI